MIPIVLLQTTTDSAQPELGAALLGLLIAVGQLLVGLGFAMLAVYAGIRIFDKLTTGIDEMAELRRGNTAIGVLMGAVVIAYATVISGGVASLTNVVLGIGDKSVVQSAIALLGGVINLLIGLGLASFAITMAMRIFGKITKEMDEQAELKRGNLAVAFLLAAILFAVATVISAGVASVGTAISNLGAALFA